MQTELELKNFIETTIKYFEDNEVRRTEWRETMRAVYERRKLYKNDHARLIELSILAEHLKKIYETKGMRRIWKRKKK